MELKQVRYFLALSEELNFTRAAEACNVTQPALTNAIKRLEDEMGGPLIHRERANSHLTELGQMVLPFLQQVYESSCAASQLAKEVSLGNRVPLNFGVSDVVPKSALLSPLRVAQANAEGLEIHVEGGSDRTLVQQLTEGALHLVLVEEAAVDTERLRFFPVYREEFALLMPVDDPLAEANSLALEQLAERQFIDVKGSPAHGDFSAALAHVIRDFAPRHRATRSVESQTLCLAGMGLTLIGDHEAILPGLTTRHLPDLCLHRQIGLAEARGRPSSSTVQSFSRLLRAQSFVPADAAMPEARTSAGSGLVVKSAAPKIA